MRQIALLTHHEPLFGAPPSDSTIRRTLEPIGADELLQRRLARARARVRRHVWDLIAATKTGFAWLSVTGKVLTGWIVIDLDATLITAPSSKQGAWPRSRRAGAFTPGRLCANTHQSLAMLLRTGSAGSTTACDHVCVLSEAIAQIPDTFRAKIWIRIDGAGATP